jgi:hypothetical protein
MACHVLAVASDRRFLQADEHGSIVAISNGAGATIAINSYDEYGNPAATNPGRLHYTGQARHYGAITVTRP